MLSVEFLVIIASFSRLLVFRFSLASSCTDTCFVSCSSTYSPWTARRFPRTTIATNAVSGCHFLGFVGITLRWVSVADASGSCSSFNKALVDCNAHCMTIVVASHSIIHSFQTYICSITFYHPQFSDLHLYSYMWFMIFVVFAGWDELLEESIPESDGESDGSSTRVPDSDDELSEDPASESESDPDSDDELSEGPASKSESGPDPDDELSEDPASESESESVRSGSKRRRNAFDFVLLMSCEV